jgi:molybdopterin-guanine dinucleotide biosynthesis protein A
VLAGGTGRRFGGKAKGLEEVGGRRIIDRVAAALAKVSDELLVAANDEHAGGWLPGVTIVRDRHPGAGGLAGIDAAFAAVRGDLLVVAWDMPFVSAALLQLLIASRRNSQAEVVVPESPSPYGFEPFCALYGGEVAPALDRFLAHGGGAARDFLGTVRMQRVPLAEVGKVGDPARLLLSVNTPEELDRARAIAAG